MADLQGSFYTVPTTAPSVLNPGLSARAGPVLFVQLRRQAGVQRSPALHSFERHLCMLRIGELCVVSLNLDLFRKDARDNLSDLVEIVAPPIRYVSADERRRAQPFA